MKGSLLSAGIVEPYAQALMDLSQANNLTQQFGEEIASLLNLLSQSPELQQFLASPVVKAEDKQGILQRIAGEQVHPYIMNFLKILVNRGRIQFLEPICQQYRTLLNKLNQVVVAEVTSAVPLNENQQQAIREQVIGISGAQNVEIETRIEPDLIGGVIIKVGSQIIDSSLRGQLRRIGIRLNSAA